METFEEQLRDTLPKHYGLPVTSIGEDGEYLVLGHPGWQRAIAAANRYARKEIGLRNLTDDPGIFLDDIEARELWARPGHAEECPLVREFHRYCSVEPRGLLSWLQPRVVEPGDEIQPDDDCGCATAGRGESWYVRYGAAPGAFPITVVQ